MAAHAKKSRLLLCAGISTVALLVASAELRAADLPPRMITKAPVVVPSAWQWWVEGGAFWTAGEHVNFGDPIAQGKPKVGPEVAVGLDYRFGDGWHIAAQARYGWASGGASGPFSLQSAPVAPFIFTNGTVTTNKETHWLADFTVGRDLGVGNMQAKFGLRVAELTAKTSGTFSGGTMTAPPSPMVTLPFSGAPEQQSKFLGYGPRVALEGSTPIRPAWTIDWQVGGGVLFGDRKLDLTGGNPASVHFQNFSSSKSATVPNVDGMLGLSYWFSAATKMTLSYRADAYFGALTTFNATGTGTQNIDRIYHGPMIRFTYKP
jgi:hypothetical protein